MDFTNLQVLAEVSVALLGFSGITAIVGQSQFAQQGVKYRVLGLLYSSSLAFMGTILPLIGIPVRPAAAITAALVLAGIIWAGMNSFGPARKDIRPNLVLVLVFFPISVLVNLYLWYAIIVLTEQILLAIQLQVGVLLLLATVYFVRLVSSALGKTQS